MATADSGLFDDRLLSFLEQRRLPYIVVARLTLWVKRAAQRVEQWTLLDDNFAVGEFRLKLYGWSVERRFVVVRERVREDRDSLGRKLIDVPGYTFRVFVTSSADAPQEIWRDYNRRADMENRVAELKHDLGADGFCLKEFFATEAAFRSVLLLFNLRRHSRPSWSSPGCPPVAELGRLKHKDPLAGEHLELANSNFAEVGSDAGDLTSNAADGAIQAPQRGGESALNFGIQGKSLVSGLEIRVKHKGAVRRARVVWTLLRDGRAVSGCMLL
ncbi:MAG TPA: transposase [Bryobacteraceae bacterium]|nr:transposase [Bryobacteraceae bacterium]